MVKRKHLRHVADRFEVNEQRCTLQGQDMRVRGELVDSFDEELEMEIDDERLQELFKEFAERPDPAALHHEVCLRVRTRALEDRNVHCS